MNVELPYEDSVWVITSWIPACLYAASDLRLIFFGELGPLSLGKLFVNLDDLISDIGCIIFSNVIAQESTQNILL